MKKGIMFILLIAFLVFVGTEIVYAYSYFGGFFGGRIINTKALQIQNLELSGFDCVVPGTSIQIIPMGSPAGTPVDYLIPSYVIPKTRTVPSMGQLILGKYQGQTLITCTYPSNPPIVVTVNLDNITLFGTSR